MDFALNSMAGTRLYTAAEVRRLDRCAIEEHGIAGADLMERAGTAAFDAIVARFGEIKTWVIVCGGGNNGGDGYVVARLAREAGLESRVYALKSPAALSGDAASAAQRWLDTGGKVEEGAPGDIQDGSLVVDALLGTGLDRPAEGAYADAISVINLSACPVAAIDIPSGLNADTGTTMGGRAVEADLTITFIGNKRGLYTADGPDHAGIVQFMGLEVPDSIYESITNSGILINEQTIANNLRKRLRNSHKGEFGWVLGVGGDRGMSGALQLCGMGALRAGAGKVTLLTHPDHAPYLNANAAELMVSGVAGGEQIGEWADKADVVVLGTGLGRSSWSHSIFDAGMQVGRPLVIDADGLNLLALAGKVEQLRSRVDGAILTPHPAEAARLLGVATADIQGDRVAAAQKLASSSGAIVVLKGCGTVVAAPDGQYAVCALGNPGMATAGTGDVLAGVIGALRAQGLDAFLAAQVGVAAHAAAGDRAAAELGQRGMIAGDISSRLPLVLNPD